MFPLKDDIPTRSFPIVTVAIIAINVLMFFLFQGAYFDDADFDKKTVEYGAIPYEITHPGDHCDLTADGGAVACEGQPGVTGEAPDQAPTWLTILTSMFMHGGLLHIGGNMLFLWIFGNNIEDSMGKGRFVAFYLLGGLVAVLAQTLIEPNAAVPTIGASGAVAGVLGGYALLISTRARGHAAVHHHLLHHRRAAGSARARRMVRAPGAVRSHRGDPAGGRRRGRRVLRPHRRVPVRAGHDQAVRQPRARGLRAGAPNAGLLMNARTAALIASLALIGLLAFLTIDVMINDGFTPLVAISLLILGLLGFGVVGALTTPPEE